MRDLLRHTLGAYAATAAIMAYHVAREKETETSDSYSRELRAFWIWSELALLLTRPN